MPNVFDFDSYIHKLKILKKIASDAFTSSPTGNIDITRVIDQKPDYYVKPAPETRMVNKTLIFADWSQRTYTEKQAQITLQIFQRLLDEKFEIYVFRNNTFKHLLNANELNKYTIDITPVNQEDIKHLAVKRLKKPSDEFYIFDFEEMRRIFFPNHEKLQSCIPVNAYAYTFLLHKFQHYFTQNPPNGILISSLNVDTSYYSSPNQTLQKFYGAFPQFKNLPIYTEIENLGFECDNLTTADENVFLTALKSESPTSAPLSLEQTSNIHIILPKNNDFMAEKVFENFSKFTASTPQLTSLTIENTPSSTNIPLALKVLTIYHFVVDILTLCINSTENLSIYNYNFSTSPSVTFR